MNLILVVSTTKPQP